MERKRFADLQSGSLQIEKEIKKAQARVKIYEGESIEQKVPLKTLAMADIKAGGGRYPVIKKKQKYLDQNEKLNATTQFQAKSSINRFSTTSMQQEELQKQ